MEAERLPTCISSTWWNFLFCSISNSCCSRCKFEGEKGSPIYNIYLCTFSRKSHESNICYHLCQWMLSSKRNILLVIPWVLVYFPYCLPEIKIMPLLLLACQDYCNKGFFQARWCDVNVCNMNACVCVFVKVYPNIPILDFHFKLY